MNNPRIIPAAFLGVGIILAIAAAWWGLSRRAAREADPGILALARCLKEKNVTMYGAYWCPHCQNEKKRFGAAWREVPYVECTEEAQTCIAAGINGYPTWILPDGRKLEGEQGLEKLATESDCPRPQPPATRAGDI